MIRASEQTKELFNALIAAQAKFPVALKVVKNEFTKKNYADFQSVVEAVRSVLAENKMGFTQMLSRDESGTVLITRIFHESGQWYESSATVKSVKEDPQSLGAAITYMKRYALQAALGVIAADEDSDAEKAMGRDDLDRPATKAAVAELLKSFKTLNITEAQILKYVGVAHAPELTVKNLEELWDIGTNIHNKKAKKEDYFK